MEQRSICITVERHKNRADWECHQPTPPGQRLCDRCLDDAYNGLHDIRTRWPGVLKAQREHAHQAGEKVARTPSSVVPVNLPAIQFVQDATQTLHFWTRLILDEHTDYTGPDVTAPDMAAWLATHIKDLANLQDEAVVEGLVGDIRTLARTAHHITHPDEAARYVPLGDYTCQQGSPDEPCHGTIHAKIKDDTVQAFVCVTIDPATSHTTINPKHQMPPTAARLIAARRATPANIRAL